MMAVLMLGSSVAAFAQDAKALNEEVKALKAQWDKQQQAVLIGQGDVAAFGDITLQLFDKFHALDKVAQQPDAKGKVKNPYRKANAEVMHQNRGSLVNAGIEAFNGDNNQKALELFGAYVGHAKDPMMEKYNYAQTDSLLPTIAYYATLAAARVENNDKMLEFSEMALNDKENGGTAMELKCQALKNLNRTDEWIACIKEGMAKYPNDNFFSANLVDYYMSNNKADEAIAFIDGEIAKNPGSYYNYYMKGFMLNQQKKYDAADEAYAKAATMNDDMVQLYSYAGLNLCQAAIELGEKEDADQNKINEYYKRALPYYTKARQLAPDDQTMWKNGLYTIYYRLNMETEFKEIEALM